MALITKQSELRAYLPVKYSAAATLPSFDLVTERYLLPVLGDDLLDTLQAAYDSPPLNATLTALLKKCQAVLAPLSYLSELPLLQTLLSDNGIQRVEGDNMRGAFRWEYNAVVAALEERGYNALEQLIVFLKKNKEDYPDWETSPYHDSSNFALIRDGADLGSVLSIVQPHRCFVLVKSLLLKVEEMHLRPSLSSEYYEALNQKIIDDDLDEHEDKILRKLRMASANLLMYYAATEMSVRFGEQGFTVVSAATSTDNRNEGTVDAGASRIQTFAHQMKSSGEALLKGVLDYMNSVASETVFAEFYASNQYTSPSTNSSTMHDNSNRKNFYI